MALRQYLELARGAAGKPRSWRLSVRRGSLVTDVLAEFGKRKGSSWVFMPTAVSFVDGFGAVEEGDDAGGLTAEMFNLFFREVVGAERQCKVAPSLYDRRCLVRAAQRLMPRPRTPEPDPPAQARR